MYLVWLWIIQPRLVGGCKEGALDNFNSGGLNPGLRWFSLVPSSSLRFPHRCNNPRSLGPNPRPYLPQIIAPLLVVRREPSRRLSLGSSLNKLQYGAHWGFVSQVFLLSPLLRLGQTAIPRSVRPHTRTVYNSCGATRQDGYGYTGPSLLD